MATNGNDRRCGDVVVLKWDKDEGPGPAKVMIMNWQVSVVRTSRAETEMMTRSA